jgi:protein-tyrosine-phosphatase/DNA-binding transcriptional ArsR family regulator
MDLLDRARVHAALGDPHRLRIVDGLAVSDRTFQELAGLIGLPGNAAAHHLRILESAGLIERRVSEGDRRRRYISLRRERLTELTPRLDIQDSAHDPAILFVCTHNSARSQFAAAVWRERTGGTADSAGTEPARHVHPQAIRAAAELGIDLAGHEPKGYDAVGVAPGLVVSVCDRAHEAGVPFDAPAVHWSVPDPVRVGTTSAFRSAFLEIERRVDVLAAQRRGPD